MAVAKQSGTKLLKGKPEKAARSYGLPDEDYLKAPKDFYITFL